jgi:hypothetical protein
MKAKQDLLKVPALLNGVVEALLIVCLLCIERRHLGLMSLKRRGSLVLGALHLVREIVTNGQQVISLVGGGGQALGEVCNLCRALLVVSVARCLGLRQVLFRDRQRGLQLRLFCRVASVLSNTNKERGALDLGR